MRATYLSMLAMTSLIASTAFVSDVSANACATTTPESTSGVVGGSGGCESWGMWGCSVSGSLPVDSCGASSEGQSFNVKRTINSDGTVNWHLTSASAGFAGLDAAIWIGQKGGQNSPHLWSYDVTSASGMKCASAPKEIYFCSDGDDEFVQIDTENTDTPDVGFDCNTGELLTEVFGVHLDVTNVSPYQGDTTIVVAKSNRKCGNLLLGQPACIASNESFQIIDPSNGQVWEPDPYFGFVDPATGEITLENVCVAGLPVKNAEPVPGDDPAFQARPQCDPDETVDNGPNTDSLDVCDDRLKGVIREEFSAGFEGSGYVRGGGSNRYY